MLQVLLQLAFGSTIPVLWSMMADVADYLEWTTFRRSTGLAFASIIFGLKLGLGVGAWLNGELLQRFQYLGNRPDINVLHAGDPLNDKCFSRCRAHDCSGCAVGLSTG